MTLSDSVTDDALGAAAERLSRPGVVVAPRKMWPTGLTAFGLDLKGKIAEAAEEGRAVARLTDLGHGGALRDLFRPDTADGPVPVPLVKAVIEVLGDWQPAGDRDRGGSTRRPGRRWCVTWLTGSPASSRCRSWAATPSSTTPSRQVAVRSTPPSGWRQ